MIRSILLCGLLAMSAAAVADPTGTTPAAAAATATPAVTTPAAPAPAPASAVAVKPAAPAKPKLVCEVTHPMDSHINQRICMTPEQMAERKKADREAMERAQQVGPTGCGITGC